LQLTYVAFFFLLFTQCLKIMTAVSLKQCLQPDKRSMVFVAKRQNIGAMIADNNSLGLP